MTNSFNSNEFIQHLNGNILALPIVLLGMVQKKDEFSLQFTGSTYRDSWIRIPAIYIESIEYIDKVNIG